MFERFSKGFFGLFRSDRTGPGAKSGTPGRPASVRAQAVAQIRKNQNKVMAPERAELIRHAMEVHRAKKQILADLNDEQRQKLVAMAMRAFLNQTQELIDDNKASGKKTGGPAGRPAKPTARKA